MAKDDKFDKNVAFFDELTLMLDNLDEDLRKELIPSDQFEDMEKFYSHLKYVVFKAKTMFNQRLINGLSSE
jgi:hypothetical protein